MDLEDRVEILKKKVEELESWRGTTTLVDRDVDRETAEKEIREWIERKVEEGRETFYISDITCDLHFDHDLVESIMEEAAISTGEKQGILLVDDGKFLEEKF